MYIFVEFKIVNLHLLHSLKGKKKIHLCYVMILKYYPYHFK